ncbi:unnamed protein product [Cyprideis torosa]|uniref:Uncharacterized protein n=1 Tax=Cyprideis torosa TaxID=163714 RepID=A0A7R8W5D9_9CRUS|nr:unnamed protein product [Cyprideis torosa]CAG0880783.1 unnamed protein product [Cyprideis torosa]
MACECPQGLIGDGYSACVAPVLPEGCQSDEECPSNQACINGECRDPCNCGVGALCEVINHRPICRCPPGFEGNPNIRCEESGCKSDADCPLDKTCHQRQCVNPCILQNPCAINAECYPENHRAQCRCPPGYEGNPLVQCLPEGCQGDHECPLDKACINRQCVNPCLYQNPCAPNAVCFVTNHRPQCRCPPGLTGDPRQYCERPIPPPEPECRTDADCGTGLACINERCQNPCQLLNPCHPTAVCTVIDILPVKTMSCECPPAC